MQLSNLKALLNEHGITARKSFDQHFIVDDSVLQREVEYAEISEKDIVLEIGAGPGILTEFLARSAKKVFVIEKDSRFKEILEKIPNTEVIIGDALDISFPECSKIVSNLPYSISSDITFKILKEPIELAILCYQKEFAERMTARPHTKEYSRLSVNCFLRAEIEILETVPKGKYWPIPEVDSSIVRLKPKKFEAPEKFDAICRALFQHKRKKARNALMDSWHEISETKEEVKKFVEKIGAKAEKRVTELEPEEIIEMLKLY